MEKYVKKIKCNNFEKSCRLIVGNVRVWLA